MKTKLFTISMYIILCISAAFPQKILIEDLIFNGTQLSETIKYGYLELSGQSYFKADPDLDSICFYTMNNDVSDYHSTLMYKFDSKGFLVRKQRYREGASLSDQLNDWSEYTYNNDGKILTSVAANPDEPYLLKVSYIYNEAKECTQKNIIQIFESGNESVSWNNEYQYYDDSLLKTETRWDHGELQSKSDLAYSDRHCSEITCYSYSNNQMEKDGTIKLTYNENALLSGIKYEDFVSDNVSKFDYDENGNLICSLRKFRKGGFRTYDSTIFAYNELNQLVEEEHYENFNAHNWTEIEKYEYTYDDQERLKKHIMYTMWVGDIWEKNSVAYYHYSKKKYTEIDEENNNVLRINYSAISDEISIDGPEKSEVFVKIIDLKGTIVYQDKFSEKEIIRSNEFPTGLYIVNLTCDNHSRSKILYFK